MGPPLHGQHKHGMGRVLPGKGCVLPVYLHAFHFKPAGGEGCAVAGGKQLVRGGGRGFLRQVRAGIAAEHETIQRLSGGVLHGHDLGGRKQAAVRVKGRVHRDVVQRRGCILHKLPFLGQIDSLCTGQGAACKQHCQSAAGEKAKHNRHGAEPCLSVLSGGQSSGHARPPSMPPESTNLHYTLFRRERQYVTPCTNLPRRRRLRR